MLNNFNLFLSAWNSNQVIQLIKISSMTHTNDVVCQIYGMVYEYIFQNVLLMMLNNFNPVPGGVLCTLAGLVVQKYPKS